MSLDFARYLFFEEPPAEEEECATGKNVLQQCTYEERLGELVFRRPTSKRREDTLASLFRQRRQQNSEYRRRRDSDSGYTSPTDNSAEPVNAQAQDTNITNSKIKATFTCGTPPEEDFLSNEKTFEIHEITNSLSFLSLTAGSQTRSRVSFADERGMSLVSYYFIPQEELDFDDQQKDSEDDWDDWLFGGRHGDIYPLAMGRRMLSPPPSPPSLTSSPTMSSDEEDFSVSRNCFSTAIDQKENNVQINSTLCSLCFQQPGSSFSSFQRRLEAQCVSLENVCVEDSKVFCSVKVKNLSYEKRVSARCTYDEWLTYVEIPGSYVSSGCLQPVYDTFSFTVQSPPLKTLAKRGPRSAEFAICYQVNGLTYWDNNYGKNYRIVWRPG